MAATIPRYTVEDLEHFPNDGNRYELLDGILLVTPGPTYSHQIVATRIAGMLRIVEQDRLGNVVAPGAISFPPRTQLEPDVLVVPARFPLSSKWHELTEHWLAVEVLSRSSRIYDREFKRDAYLTLGVHEVWLVDRADRSVEVTRTRGESNSVRDVINWRVPTCALEVKLDLRDVFAGLE